MARLTSIRNFAARTCLAGTLGVAALLAGWSATFAAVPEAPSFALLLSVSGAAFFFAILAVSRFANATSLECALGCGMALLAQVIWNAIGMGGFPVPEDREGWAVVILVPMLGSSVAAFAAWIPPRLGRMNRKATIRTNE